MNAPRFSIVLPTHNRADVLPYAIRSALAQTAQDFELLIVGDGCTDDTAQVVALFKDPRITWLDLPKAPGVGYANRNVALRGARGTFIAYLAHDDIWLPDHLAELGSLIDETGAEFVYSRTLSVDLRGRAIPFWYNLEVPRHREGLWRGQSAITLCSVVHTRACLAKYGFWDDTLLQGGDVAMWHRILSGGGFQNVAFLSIPTSLHFVADWRITDGYRRRTRIVDGILDGFLDEILPPALRFARLDGQTQQQAAWLHFSTDPVARVRDLRRACVQLQDALLWQGRTVGGLIGLRFGHAIGTTVDWLWNAATWTASPAARRRARELENRTRPRVR